LDSYWMARIPHVHRQDHMHPSQKTASLGMGIDAGGMGQRRTAWVCTVP
jgi:hypothetical protein